MTAFDLSLESCCSNGTLFASACGHLLFILLLGVSFPSLPNAPCIGPHIFVFLFLLYFLTLVEHLHVWMPLLRESHWVLAYFLGSLVGYRILG